MWLLGNGWRNNWIAVITVEPAGKASFVLGCIQTRLMGQYNGKWPVSLVYMSKPLITVITAIIGIEPRNSIPFSCSFTCYQATIMTTFHARMHPTSFYSWFSLTWWDGHVQNNGKMSLKFCIIIEQNSQKNFFVIVLYTNMAAVTSCENRESFFHTFNLD